jgi:hypothetical protein
VTLADDVIVQCGGGRQERIAVRIRGAERKAAELQASNGSCQNIEMLSDLLSVGCGFFAYVAFIRTHFGTLAECLLIFLGIAFQANRFSVVKKLSFSTAKYALSHSNPFHSPLSKRRPKWKSSCPALTDYDVSLLNGPYQVYVMFCPSTNVPFCSLL